MPAGPWLGRAAVVLSLFAWLVGTLAAGAGALVAGYVTDWLGIALIDGFFLAVFLLIVGPALLAYERRPDLLRPLIGVAGVIAALLSLLFLFGLAFVFFPSAVLLAAGGVAGTQPWPLARLRGWRAVAGGATLALLAMVVVVGLAAS